MYNRPLLNTILFILICVILQVIVFSFIVYTSAKPSLKLEQVVILSRHNVRTPLSKNLARMTQQRWPHWNEKPGFLTEKGFLLESYMGKFFAAWLKEEGLLPKQCPSEEDFYVYSNGMERTLQSTHAFLKGSFPNCNITVHHADINKPDPIFTPMIHNSTEVFKKIALKEMENILNDQNFNKSYRAMEDILNYNESDCCLIDNDCYLEADKMNIDLVVGMKPKVTGPMKICNEAIDAFLMAYYNGFPLNEVAWGKLNDKKWSTILEITAGYHNLTFCAKHIARDIAQPLIKYLTNIFLNKNTKVTLLMGHDANINVLLTEMLFKPYVLDYNFISTPVGGKIVFQKWLDEKLNEYVLKIEYVYQSNDQLRDGTTLSIDCPPQFKILELQHCRTDYRGFSSARAEGPLKDLTYSPGSIRMLTFQRKAAKGLRLKERKVPPAVLGRIYAQYCDVINRMYDAYLSHVQLQRAPAMLHIVSVIWKRLYELRQELVGILVNDYIYVDDALVSLKKTPYDIQIIVPYHYPLESRSQGMEELLQTMWAETERRKAQELALSNMNLKLNTKTPISLKRQVRRYMRTKREAVLNHRRDVILGIAPDPFQKRLDLEEENNKIYERTSRIRKDLQEKYAEEMEREKTRLIVFKKDNQIEDITEHIWQWFREWYEGYGFFPGYPYEAEGGTVMVIREDYPYIEEQIEEDEKLAIKMKGKTKEMLIQEQKQAKLDAEMREELAKEQRLKEAELLFKMRCNPLADPGHEPKQSMHTGSIVEALKNYRAAWSIYDSFPEEYPSVVYGYMQAILTEDLMNQLHMECRKYVDELMRLDLKLLIKMHQKMYQDIGKKYPKLKPRKKPKEEPIPVPFDINDKILRNLQIPPSRIR
ncbi:uncharacterized protein LOC112047601 [Bicyclus anynana]|uniref:Uncharacterized protein LOC112047601 n=1 Tax=Bicyclus anynana TaxID=110368 RepID=A0ABM3LIC1_BICAN|nr:uncharacterized protein LOC112047601 [Bicyclus anynana]